MESFYMSRSVIKYIAATLALSSSLSLWSWGPSRPENSQSEMMPLSDSFPLNDQQGWYTKETYLLWHPHEDDVDWADRVTTNVGSDIDLSVDLKRPDFDWYSGVRLAVGRYLPNHDHWDLSLTGTYFYANSHSRASSNLGDGQTVQPLWEPTTLITTGGNGNWRLNFFTFDLGLGRNLWMSSKISTHPFIDLRSVLVYESDSAKYSLNGVATQQNHIKFKGHNDYWGIGPRIGSDFTFYLSKFWTILGSLSGSILMGGSKVHQHVNSNITQPNPQVPTRTVTQNTTVSHHEYAIRGNLEGSIGMGWEKWVNRNRVRIAPSVVLEAAQWYDMNQWIALNAPSGLSSSGPTYFETNRRHGDLTFWGFNFNIQVDF